MNEIRNESSINSAEEYRKVVLCQNPLTVIYIKGEHIYLEIPD